MTPGREGVAKTVNGEPASAAARWLHFIRFSHTVFALPFAAGAMLVAARGWPGWRLSGLILLCMVWARTAAMVFNRLADWEIDRRNPRTEGRHRLVTKQVAVIVLVFASAGFVSATWWINSLCFWLSPVALVVIFFYSLTKRFTTLSHFFLGLALAVAPVGAWLAVTGHFALPPLVLAAAVLLWVAGFDLIYATQDFEFDRMAGLRSLVVKLGIPASLRVAEGLHCGMFLLLIGFGLVARLHAPFAISLMGVVGALVYEHRVARRGDLTAINQAFFWSNAVVGGLFVAGIVADLCW